MTDISFNGPQGRFHYRVGGVVLHNGRVLLVTDERFDFWFLPGGKAALMEPSDEVLKREVTEELDVTPVVERLLWTTESFFNLDFWGGAVHEVGLLYLMHFPQDAAIYEMESGSGMEEEEVPMRFQWFKLDELGSLNLVPHFLKEALKNIPEGPKHIINNEL